jgi:hypothetical protein
MRTLVLLLEEGVVLLLQTEDVLLGLHDLVGEIIHISFLLLLEVLLLDDEAFCPSEVLLQLGDLCQLMFLLLLQLLHPKRTLIVKTGIVSKSFLHFVDLLQGGRHCRVILLSDYDSELLVLMLQPVYF